MIGIATPGSLTTSPKARSRARKPRSAAIALRRAGSLIANRQVSRLNPEMPAATKKVRR